ncbi:MAG: sigma 54-interacting transcriptional regulator [Pseudomonadota bacterium]
MPNQDKPALQSSSDLELSKRLREFRDLLLSLSIKCIGLQADKVDSEIDGQLRLVSELWHFDRIVLYQLDEKENRLDVLGRFPGSGNADPSIPVINEETLLESFGSVLGDSSDACFARNGTLILPVQKSLSKRVQLLFHSSAIASWSDELMGQLRCFADLLSGLLKIKNTAKFYILLSEVSATYINLPVEQIEGALRKDFARLSKALDVEICSLHLYDEESGRLWVRMLPFVWYLDEYHEESKPFAEYLEWLKRNPRVDPETYEYSRSRIARGETVSWNRIEDIPDNEGGGDKSVLRRIGLKSSFAVPVWFNGVVVGSISCGTLHKCCEWPADMEPRLRLFAEVFVNAIMRKRSEEKLRNALDEIKKLKDRLEEDYTYLKEESEGYQKEIRGLVGKSPVMKKLAATVRQVGPTNTSVLILGETGVGKGLLARAIHTASTRKNRPFMQVNCAAFSASLIESELFGHEKGAFTGAISRRVGRFEAAAGTTLFLDEIGDLPLELQPKLLRLLEEGEFERVGGTLTIKTDVRVIAATNRDLRKEAEAGRFREDLWYRLNVFPIIIPPLRERPEDIPLLLFHFIDRFQKDMGKNLKSIPPVIIAALKEYSWPGNVRELKNFVERVIITGSAEDFLHFQAPRSPDGIDKKAATSLADEVKTFEREKLIKALEESRWVIEGPKGAARRLGLKPTTLRRHIKSLDIKK